MVWLGDAGQGGVVRGVPRCPSSAWGGSVSCTGPTRKKQRGQRTTEGAGMRVQRHAACRRWPGHMRTPLSPRCALGTRRTRELASVRPGARIARAARGAWRHGVRATALRRPDPRGAGAPATLPLLPRLGVCPGHAGAGAQQHIRSPFPIPLSSPLSPLPRPRPRRPRAAVLHACRGA